MSLHIHSVLNPVLNLRMSASVDKQYFLHTTSPLGDDVNKPQEWPDYVRGAPDKAPLLQNIQET